PSMDLRTPLPTWLNQNVAPEPHRSSPIKPSGFVDDPELADAVRSPETRQRALARGVMVHRLLQSLPDIPPERRAEAARRYVALRQSGFSEPEYTAMIEAVISLLADPRFAALFAIGSRAEVPIVGWIGNELVNGVIDRLVVTPAEVLIADYKTNR